MLATLSVVREKDLGSIINFYVTPTTRLEFLLGKQLPYVALGMLSFLLLVLSGGKLFFRVPMKGDFLTDAAGTLLYVTCSHRPFGILISTLTRTQVAALFATTILTLVPGGEFLRADEITSFIADRLRSICGKLFTRLPITLLSPAGTFSKALGFAGLHGFLHSAFDHNPGAHRVERAVLEETGELNMSGKNILHLGMKEMWSLARDPIMVLLIVYAFTLSIYSISTASARLA